MKRFLSSLFIYFDALTKMWQQNPVISNGEQAVSLALEDGEDCLVYTYRLTEYAKSQFNEAQLSYMQDNIRTNIIPILKSQASQAELIRRCMDEEYVFKYIYQDKDGEFLCSVKITPDDYK